MGEQSSPVLELAHTRRSIRRYTEQPVSLELVEHVLEVARWAPSAHNRQPWRFVVLTEAQAKMTLAEAMAARLRADRLADGDRIEAVDADAARSQTRISAAPVVLVLCLTLAEMDRYPDERRARAEYLMAVQSVAMAAQNLLLAAHEAGLGACWMCAPLFCPDVVRAALDLPDDWEPQALITLGYPASEGKPASRKALNDIVIWK
ncbi:MAG: nitroreductase family protein [Anaerolineales bacterium]